MNLEFQDFQLVKQLEIMNNFLHNSNLNNKWKPDQSSSPLTNDESNVAIKK